MIALFGDSYIEGFLTDVDQHVDAYLPQHAARHCAYAFGVSGWYLEQYVAVARYVHARFQPDVLVIFIDDGDVTDSLRENGVSSPFWWQIGARGSRSRSFRPLRVYTVSRKRSLAKKSALVDYLRYNAGLTLPGMRNAGVAQPAARGRSAGPRVIGMAARRLPMRLAGPAAGSGLHGRTPLRTASGDADRLRGRR